MRNSKLMAAVMTQSQLPAGIGSKLTTPKASGVTLKWKRNGDVEAPLMEYWVEELAMRSNFTHVVRIRFNPSKLKKWEVMVAGMASAFFEGTRTDVTKMELVAEAMLEQLRKEKEVVNVTA